MLKKMIFAGLVFFAVAAAPCAGRGRPESLNDVWDRRAFDRRDGG